MRYTNRGLIFIYRQYTYHTYGSCETREQSAEVFTTHATFLLRCMIQGDAGVEWKKTNVFVHLRRQFNVSKEATSFTITYVYTDNRSRKTTIGW